MHDVSDFLAKIVAEPDADAPRLVFADWLQENGQEDRAGFIRVQCELSAIPTEPPVCRPVLRGGRPEPVHHHFCEWCNWVDEYRERRDALRKRERELLELDSAWEWFRVPGLAVYWLRGQGPKGWLSKKSGEVTEQFPVATSRGFVERVECPAADWLAHGDAIVAKHPVRNVVLTDLPFLRTAATSRTDDDAWLVGGPDRRLRANDVVARVRSNGDNHFGRAMLELYYPGIRFKLPNSG